MTRNRQGMKGNDKENRTGNKNPIPAGYKKLPDNPKNTEDSISTRNDSANGKYSRTDKRDEDIDNKHTRGGS
jgi:hypothetical protein